MISVKAEPSEWFDGKSKYPRYIGVYELQIPHVASRCYSYWNGTHWLRHARFIVEADDSNRPISIYQDQFWRGLAEESKLVGRGSRLRVVKV